MPFAEKLKFAMRDRLVPGERTRVEAEIRKTDWFKEYVKQYGEEPNLSESADYDYLTAWKTGVRPERDPYDENKFHWGSYAEVFGQKVKLKKPEHRTLWKSQFMEETGINPDSIGLKDDKKAQKWLKEWRTKGAAAKRMNLR